jgi:hypothetical protein
MSKARNVLGLVAAAILIFSSAMHTFLGWPSLGSRLEAVKAPPDLIQGLEIGWKFGGLAMLVFGIIVTMIFVARLRGDMVSTLPALILGIAYIAFGAWAFAVTKNPFFSIFIAPGALLFLAASRR